jgi:histidine ammonia-lyase
VSSVLQVKSFEADVVEAQGYKGAIAAADELKGLLEGSKVVGTRKGLSPEQQAAYSSLPQVLGAVSDALGTAYNAVRPEVQSAALPVKVSAGRDQMCRQGWCWRATAAATAATRVWACTKEGCTGTCTSPNGL